MHLPEKPFPAVRMASPKSFSDWPIFLLRSAWAVMIMATAGHSLVPILAAGGPRYEVTDLGPIMPYAINNKGQVAGQSLGGRPFFWDAGTLIELDVYGFASDLNDAGQMVGSYIDPLLDEDQAFLWQDLNGNGEADLGELRSLATLGGEDSTATAVNSQGQVVGYSSNSDGDRRAFFWQNGTMTDLGTLGGNRSQANGINDVGQVVGESRIASGSLRAFLWDGGGMQNLGAFDDDSGAHAINNAGQVTGFDYHDGLITQFLWLPEPTYGLPAGMNSLDFAANRFFGSVSGINDRGQVAGLQTLWQNGVATPISDLLPPGSGWTINTITDINDNGQILGNGIYDGQIRGFILTPPKWTLLFYIAGDNNLSHSYWHAFNQLERAANNPAVQVVVAWDAIDSDMEYYHLQHDTNLNELALYKEGETLWNQGEPDMGSPATLSDFVIWAMDKFPSQHYALILDNHGQGLGSFLVDDTNDGAMNLAELKLALGTIHDQTGRTPDVLYMAMCLMGLIEDAYQVRDYTDYYVASQDLQWAFSLPYHAYVADINNDSTPEDVAVNFATAYHTVAVASHHLGREYRSTAGTG